MLTFSKLREANVGRCKTAFKTCADWTVADWLVATMGELGELANFIKKVRRGDFTFEESKEDLGKELADVAIYLDLLADALQIDLGQAIVDKFNEVSARRGSDITL